MAGIKSSEENILYQCIKCHRHKVVRNGIDGASCNYCDGYLQAMGSTNLPTSNEGKKAIHYGDIKITVDVIDALKGLKAMQRELRKTTTALRELEGQKSKAKGNKLNYIIVDEMHGTCPECSGYITTENIHADGYEQPLKQIRHCVDCGWHDG